MKSLGLLFSTLLGICMALLLMGLILASDDLSSMGLFVLIAIPVLRSFYAVFWFARHKNRRATWTSAVVLALWGLSLYLGTRT